jgi:C4-dicarboxylate-specific signal transduction histidine kinase
MESAASAIGFFRFELKTSSARPGLTSRGDRTSAAVVNGWPLPSSSPLEVLGDRVPLQQCVLNLLLNAFDALIDTAEHERRV